MQQTILWGKDGEKKSQYLELEWKTFFGIFTHLIKVAFWWGEQLLLKVQRKYFNIFNLHIEFSFKNFCWVGMQSAGATYNPENDMKPIHQMKKSIQ